MARRATAAARAPAPRRTTRPRPARRASGPARRKAAEKPLRRKARSRAANVLDTLIFGRSWIGLVAVLLVGIVFFNVDLLQLNRNLARTTDRSAAIRQHNARLRLELARLASSERIQQEAAHRGLVLPAPGEVRYLRAHPGVDGRLAVRRATSEPSPQSPPPGPQPSSPQPSAPSPQAPVAQRAPAPVTPQAPSAAAPAPQPTPAAGAPSG